MTILTAKLKLSVLRGHWKTYWSRSYNTNIRTLPELHYCFEDKPDSGGSTSEGRRSE